jgi:exonuclease SbcC
MLPLRLEIKNFLAYRAPDAIRFEGIHLACLTGPNGAGKSSLLDAITWALWGQARAKRDEELIHLGQAEMSVQFDFEQEGITYRVIRRRTRGKSSMGALDLFSLAEDGTPTTLSEPSMRATQAKINRLLRLTYDTFVHSAFLQQGKADAFTTKPPRERKQILSDILGLSRWEDYEELAKETLKELGENINLQSALIAEIDEALKKAPYFQTLLAEAEQAEAEARAAREEAEARLREVEHASNDLRRANELRAVHQRRQGELARDLGEVEQTIAVQTERVAAHQAVIDAQDEIEAGYAALLAARADDQALAAKLMALSALDEERRALERAIEAERAQLTNAISAGEAAIEALQRTIAASKPEETKRVQAEVTALQHLDAQRTAFQTELTQLEAERGALTAANRALRETMNAIRDRLDRLEAVEGALCPLCGQPLEEARRQELIAELNKEGKEQGDLFRSNEARLKELSATIEERRAAIEELGIELRRLDLLRQQAAVLEEGLRKASEAAVELERRQAELAALRGQLEAEAYAPEHRQQLGELEARRAALDYDSERHSLAREKLEAYGAYESRQMQLETARSALPEAQAALAEAQARRARLHEAQAEVTAELETLETQIAELEALVKEQQAREAEVIRLRAEERAALQKVVDARQELNAIDAQRARRVDLENRLRALREQESIYSELRTAFGKKGVPAMIIETAIPELEAAANHLLARMTDGRMSLTMPTQRDKVTGGVAETLDIHIADELGTRSYEMFSGGEAFRINFAIRVALSQLLARRAGAQLRTLFLDEGFGTQDDDGRNKLVEAITAIQEDFDIILVITHIEDLRDSFPVHIQIEKTSDGSRIMVR